MKLTALLVREAPGNVQQGIAQIHAGRVKKQKDCFARDLARQEAPKGPGIRPKAPVLLVAAGCLLDVWQLVVHAAAEECCHALHPHRKECEVGAWYASASSRHDMQLLAHTVSKAT